jgi:hypothetical protein
VADTLYGIRLTILEICGRSASDRQKVLCRDRITVLVGISSCVLYRVKPTRPIPRIFKFHTKLKREPRLHTFSDSVLWLYIHCTYRSCLTLLNNAKNSIKIVNTHDIQLAPVYTVDMPSGPSGSYRLNSCFPRFCHPQRLDLIQVIDLDSGDPTHTSISDYHSRVTKAKIV